MFPAMLNKFCFTVSIFCVVVDSITKVSQIWFTTLLATVHNVSERSYDKPAPLRLYVVFPRTSANAKLIPKTKNSVH
jgi:hypothetical protein